ncbi:MAG: hypothetical protein AB1566_12495 [Chloroflexota bacterium]
MLVSVYIPFAVIKQRHPLPGRYILLLALLAVEVITGWLLNVVPSQSIFVGIRVYFKYIPLFLLPFAYRFSEVEIKKQLFLIGAFAILQLPISVYQRLVQFKGFMSGDVVSGTLTISSFLSIFLVSVISVLYGLYLKKQLNLLSFLVMTSICFLPTTINETKGTLFLLPLGLLVVNFVSGVKTAAVKRFLLLPCLIVIMLGLFIPVYDHFIRSRWGYGILDFFTMEGRVEHYFFRGASGQLSSEKLGRIDSMVLAYNELSKDPFQLLFGLGAGNVTVPAFADFAGENVSFLSAGARMTTFTNCFWEIGLVGFGLYLAMMTTVLRDTRRAGQGQGLASGLAAGWCGVVAVMMLSLVYKNTLHHTFTLNMFWYLSGLAVSGADHPKTPSMGSRYERYRVSTTPSL